ncbi:hypothetical protein TNCV_3735901 [Trichonephila clavipes]|nr:hypothetical protein TNCV_3735901 [Trichonephila clavipes]
MTTNLVNLKLGEVTRTTTRLAVLFQTSPTHQRKDLANLTYISLHEFGALITRLPRPPHNFELLLSDDDETQAL